LEDREAVPVQQDDEQHGETEGRRAGETEDEYYRRLYGDDDTAPAVPEEILDDEMDEEGEGVRGGGESSQAAETNTTPNPYASDDKWFVWRLPETTANAQQVDDNANNTAEVEQNENVKSGGVEVEEGDADGDANDDDDGDDLEDPIKDEDEEVVDGAEVDRSSAVGDIDAFSSSFTKASTSHVTELVAAEAEAEAEAEPDEPLEEQEAEDQGEPATQQVDDDDNAELIVPYPQEEEEEVDEIVVEENPFEARSRKSSFQQPFEESVAVSAAAPAGVSEVSLCTKSPSASTCTSITIAVIVCLNIDVHVIVTSFSLSCTTEKNLLPVA
jgi:hypothetical protein